MEDYDNEKIKVWATKNLADLKKTGEALGIQHRKGSPNATNSLNNVSVKLRQRTGMTDKISFSMRRSLVFVHKGVGRGFPISNPRTAKRWFDIPTEINLPDLQKIVAENDVTFVINNLTIK